MDMVVGVVDERIADRRRVGHWEWVESLAWPIDPCKGD